MNMLERHNYILRNARIIDPGRGIDAVGDLGLMDGLIVDPGEVRNPEEIDAAGCIAAPGFIDMHVHLRQPGNSTAETIASGSRAAAAGGFTAIVAMPNTTPATDSVGTIEMLRRSIALDSVVKIMLSGAMTKNLDGQEMAPIGSLKQAGVVALTDDGRCVQNHDLMRHIVEYAKSFELPILDHCEEKTLAACGVMHEGVWSLRLGMRGMAGAAEELIVARDIILAEMIDWRIHLQHLSTRASVEQLRQARARGIKVSGEATPHHLALTDENIKRFDTNYKMNPPLRSEADRQALLAGLADGTITVLATDHAPHTLTSKLVEFDDAPFGIVGLETAVPVTLKELCHSGVLSYADWVAKFTTGPAEVLGLGEYTLAEGRPADVTLIEPDFEYVIDAGRFLSKSRNTPFDGMAVRGRARATFVCGQKVFDAES